MEYKRERIINYEEYQVDTNGVIYSKKGRPLKPSINRRGYKMVTFMKNGKRVGFSVHTLVAKQFIKNTDANKNQVNHIDGNKLNNNVDNLQWVTPKENTYHAINVLGYDKIGKNNPKAKRVYGTDKQGNVVYDFPSLADAARFFTEPGFNYRATEGSIWRSLNGLRKTYKKIIWTYNVS